MRLRIRSYFTFSSPIDFTVCGTQRGGTTALDSYLREHPEICMADRKEVHFFDDEKYFAKGKRGYAMYHAFFSPKKNHRIIGEATPDYMYWRPAPERMHNYNPQLKLIVLLRNPVARAYSNWNLERSRGRETWPFWEAITNEKDRCREAQPLQHRTYSYIDRGFYLRQLRRLWQYFPKENVLVLKSDLLKKQPADTLNQVCDFLQLPRLESVVEKRVHAYPYESPMSDRERNYLVSVFEQEIKDLEVELGWDCSDWLGH